MIRTKLLLLTTGLIFILISCKKEKNLDVLGGETNIELTKVGSVTSIYPSIGTYNFPKVDVVVTRNDNGYVTYKLNLDLDLRGNPDSAVISDIVDYLKDRNINHNIVTFDSNGLVNLGINMRITSEGYQIVAEDGKPQTLVKYSDPLGTEYSYNIKNSSQKIIGKITEKTGLDDWPLGFLYIKTSKVEFQYPSSYPLLDKVTIRANHKFGIVYLEVKTKRNDISPAKMSLYPWFLL